jgi:general nucleoside transport system permease protein
VTVTPEGERPHGTVAVTQWFSTRLGGILVPIAATVLAFLIGGLVVAITGNNPVSAYKAIFEGTGLNWFFPWVTGESRDEAARDLQQTLLVTTPLILTALAVAFAFRCGLFNIGGQGQFWVGLIAAIYVGTHLEGTPRPLHVLLALLAAILAGAIWGGIAGLFKATVGAHEVITTIMLNWIAIFLGSWLFGLGGPLQGGQESLPRSATIFESAQLWQIWGRIQALHAGLFIALFALIVYHVLLNRTTLGYEVRAVGFNPDAARYSGISVSRNYFLAMGIAGAFAGLAGGVDVTGWRHDIDVSDFATNFIGFTGIAVALLGRNKAVGILFAALLFGALQVGTSSRQLDPSVFDPELAENLSTMIQAMVIFFVGAELLIVYIWQARRYLGLGRKPAAGPPARTESPE